MEPMSRLDTELLSQRLHLEVLQVMGDFTFYTHMEPSYSAALMASYVEVRTRKNVAL